MLKIDLLTLFPEMVERFWQETILKRAQEQFFCQLRAVQLRDFADGKHRQVDDRPFGGGAEMVLMPEPLFKAVESLRTPETKVILTCARGSRFTPEKAKAYTHEQHLILICGRYEGVDERVRTQLVDEVVSVGDVVLSGGELPALIMVDAVVRLIPGVLGNEESLVQGAYPQYTRPADFRGMKIPDVLLSGDHAKIAQWREQFDRRGECREFNSKNHEIHETHENK
jgi:tRNA (guanine37-N1)-methyltransferase